MQIMGNVHLIMTISRFQRSRGRDVKNLTLNEHECELIADVISPTDIEVTFESIGSLEDIKSTCHVCCFVT